jgi:large subunit ribosomal protein L27
MSHVKAGGTSKNVNDSPGQRLGVKRFGGQIVKAGEVLVRQVGQTKLAGPGTFTSRNFTIHAAKDGVVAFRKVRTKRFTGKTEPRTEVMVEDAVAVTPTPAKKK